MSEIGLSLVFGLDFSVGMVLVSPFECLLGYSVNMLLGLAIVDSFGPW